LHRAGKLGLGSATVAGFRYALEHEYDFVLTMDADFSHHPRYLPDLRGPIEAADSRVDVMVGSRYVPGGGIQGWPLHRLIMSRAVNTYSRLLLGLKVNDCSGAFRCYRSSVLNQIDLDEIRSQGYSYVEEILWLLNRQGARFREAPIVFVDRELGQTKINWREAVAAVFLILRLGIKRLLWG
jgi:dolichol-phosphate mannosyltransferase